VTAASSLYKGHRYPPEIIAHCVWRDQARLERWLLELAGVAGNERLHFSQGPPSRHCAPKK
jgi:hypothetical protein